MKTAKRVFRALRSKGTRKHREKFIVLKNKTPKEVQQLSLMANQEPSTTKSFSPSINRSLVSLKSLPRKQIAKCNPNKLLLEEPLEIEIKGECVPYTSPAAKRVLLRNLAANKHIDIAKVVPPIQRQSNCWFNAMFVTFFISDKGRKFFHFFRELMISGKQRDGTPIPPEIRDAFALFNFAIDSSLSGSSYGYSLNTNLIIQRLYEIIHRKESIYNVKEAGNPIYYYLKLMNYLNNEDSKITFVTHCTAEWKQEVERQIETAEDTNVIILEFMENPHIQNKALEFEIKGAKYALDSAIIRDTDKMHFSAAITCEGKEYGFDGYTYHRIVPFSWKQYLNKYQEWGFDGSFKDRRSLFRWNFLNGYQLLQYYRVE
jgi:hypothetical protein